MTIPPDWVILGGATDPGGVAIYASKDLEQSQLRHTVDEQHGTCLPQYRHTLIVHMANYVVVYGSTYEQALRRLFEHWAPDPPAADHKPPLPAKHPQLPTTGQDH